MSLMALRRKLSFRGGEVGKVESDGPMFIWTLE
jgi:hypothetical protein